MKTNRVNHYWISDHNYLIKVLQTCLWTSSRLIIISSQCFIWYLHSLEVGVKKKKEKRKETKKMDVRCQKHLFSCVTYYLHITSRWLNIGWNTVSHIWYIKSRLRNVASSEEKKKEKKKETETYVINWKTTTTTTTTTTKIIENWKITNYITFPPANSL